MRRVKNDTSLHVRALGSPREPSPIADFLSPEYAILERTIVQRYDGALPAPNLLSAATDTRHYESLTRNVYRFVNVVITQPLLSGAHGTNERIGSTDFAHGIRCGRSS